MVNAHRSTGSGAGDLSSESYVITSFQSVHIHMMYRANLNRTLSLTYVSVSFFFSYMMPPLSLPVFVVHVLNTCAISYQHFALRLLLPHPLIRFLCFSPPFRSPEETAVNGGHSELVCCEYVKSPFTRIHW